MNQRGFSKIILLGIVAVLILAGVGGFLILREKETSAPQKPDEEIMAPIVEIPKQSPETKNHEDRVTPLPPAPVKPSVEKPQLNTQNAQLELKPEPALPPVSEQQNIKQVAPLPLPSSSEPVLKNLGVIFEPWDKSTNRAGAFIFLPTENKLFLEYGVEVESSEGGTKILPTFEYRTASDADVFSTIDGVVTNVTYEERTGDYSIHIQPELNSEWIVEHDHVSNLKVSKGNNVKAGDILGKAGTLGGKLGRTEIMMWGPGLSSTRVNTYCPFKYFDPQLISEYKQKVSQHMKDWEEFKGNPNLYNEEKHIFPGCLYKTLLD